MFKTSAQLLSVTLLVLLFTVCAGCATATRSPNEWLWYSRRGAQPESPYEDIRSLVDIQVRELVRAEHELYPKALQEAGEYPTHCLALSGGGLRSAAFNLGIIKGLEDMAVLRKNAFDVAAAVSGGSYALTWYYIERINARQQGTITSLKIDPSIAEFLNPGPLAARVLVLGLFKSIVDVASRKLADAEPTSLAHSYYIDRINQTFHKGRTAATQPLNTWSALKDHLRSGTDPYPIILATAAVTPEDKNRATANIQQVYEIAPAWHGSPWLGYIKTSDKEIMRPPFDITGAVAISGAAVDEHYVKHRWGWVPSMFRAGLGFGYKDFPIRANGADPAEMWRVQLMDGGYSDNLGITPLAMRRCGHIFVVDAGYDPQFNFDDYWKLKADLARFLELDLVIPGVEQLPARSNHHTLAKALFKGKLSEHDSKNRVPYTADVSLLKLSWTKEWTDFNDSFKSVSAYISKCEMTSQAGKRCAFPHDPTSSLTYQQDQFQAYISLGEGMAKEWLRDWPRMQRQPR